MGSPRSGVAAAELPAASRFFLDQRERLCTAAVASPVVDLACGRGRHAVAAAQWGLATVGVDRNAESLAELAARAARASLPLLGVRADLESNAAPPLRPGGCGAVLVFRYLHRPLAPAIADLLRPGGLLLYETFTRQQRTLGWGPSRDAFLLAEGELPNLFPSLEIVSYEEGLVAGEPPEATARLVARRPG